MELLPFPLLSFRLSFLGISVSSPFGQHKNQDTAPYSFTSIISELRKNNVHFSFFVSNHICSLRKICFKFNFVHFSTLLSKFGESSREFSKSDSKVHYFVLLNPNNLDMFIFITIHEDKRHSVSFHFLLPDLITVYGLNVFLLYLSFIDPERRGFGEILPEVMIFPEGLCLEGISSVSSLRIMFR
jgi:hypothetical protein